MKKVMNELKNTSILTKDEIENIRAYISKKYPNNSTKQNSQIFAQTVHKILDKNLNCVSNNIKEGVRRDIIKNTFLKDNPCIKKYDVFCAFATKTHEDPLIKNELVKWINLNQSAQVSEEIVEGFIDGKFLNEAKSVTEEEAVNGNDLGFGLLESNVHTSSLMEERENEFKKDGFKEKYNDLQNVDKVNLNSVNNINNIDDQCDISSINNVFSINNIDKIDYILNEKRKNKDKENLDFYEMVLKCIEKSSKTISNIKFKLYNNLKNIYNVTKQVYKCIFKTDTSKVLGILILASLISFEFLTNTHIKPRQDINIGDKGIKGEEKEDVDVFKPSLKEVIISDSMSYHPHLPQNFNYMDINKKKLKNFLNSRNSILAEEPYFSTIILVGREFNLNPILLFSITGQEQSFVPKDSKFAEKIANNPFNVFHSWQEYNTNIYDSTKIAARTIINLSKNKPKNVDEFEWINTKYADDKGWAKGVKSIYQKLMKEIISHK